MNNIFKLKINGKKVRELNLDIPKWNQKTYGYKSLKVLGPKVWNNLNPLKTLILSKIC